MPDFVAGGLSEAESAHAISQIIASDLKQSGWFAPINPAVFIEKNTPVDEVPEFADWRAINAQELTVGRVTRRIEAGNRQGMTEVLPPAEKQMTQSSEVLADDVLPESLSVIE